MRSNLSLYILDSNLRLLVVCVHILCLSFSKEKICSRKKQLVQDLIPPPSIYIHLCTLYTYEYVYAEIWSTWILRALQVSHSDPWAHNRVPHLYSVCVCVCIHTHTSTYTPIRVKNREDTDNTPIFPSVKNNPPRQATSAVID